MILTLALILSRKHQRKILAQLEQSRADSLILGENNQACSVLLRAKEETLTKQETAIKDLEQFQALSNKLALDKQLTCHLHIWWARTVTC